MSEPQRTNCRRERDRLKTKIDLLDKIERTTRRYYRARAQARVTLENIALNITGAPSESGVHGGGGASRVELGAMLSADAEIKANELFRELQALRKSLRPYVWEMPEGHEKTAVRMYYLRGQGLATIGRILGKHTSTTWTSDAALAALQRGVEYLRRVI